MVSTTLARNAIAGAFLGCQLGCQFALAPREDDAVAQDSLEHIAASSDGFTLDFLHTEAVPTIVQPRPPTGGAPSRYSSGPHGYVE